MLPLSMAVVVFIASLFYVDWDRSHSVRLQVLRLQRVLQANEMLLSSIKDLETGQRGYLLTGQKDHLGPYHKAKSELPQLLQDLCAHFLYPDQIERGEKLRPLISDKIVEVDAALLVRDQLGPEAALVILRSDRGKDTMDAIRKLCAEISTIANSRQVEAAGDLEERSLRSRLGILIGCAVLVGLLALALGMIYRTTARREELLVKVESERRQFHVTLSSIGDGVITTDAAGVVSFLNPVAAQLTGWDPREAEGAALETVFPIVYDITGESIENPVRVALRERRVVGMSNGTSLLRRDGSAVPIDDSAAPIFDSGQGLAGVVMVFRDMTLRRAQEQALGRWEHVFQHAGFGMAIFTPGVQPVLVQVNPAFAVMHGYEQGELIGSPYSNLVAPELWPAKAKLLDGTVRDDHRVTETIHVRKDGSRFPAVADFTQVRDAQGKVIYCTGYYSDITERKQAEEELRRSEDRYRSTADSLPQLIWTSKPDGSTEYLNNRWHEETGFTLEQTSGQGWTYFLDPDDRGACLENWNRSLQSGEIFQAECRLKTPHKEGHRWYNCRAIPMRDSEGRIIRWFGSCSDTHEQKLAADALRASKEELQLANEALKKSNMDLEQFAYAASHDLQEPLRMVAIYSQLVKEEVGGKLDQQANSYLDFAVDGALRMEALLKDLLTYSKAADVEEQVQREVNSQDALNKALANLSTMIHETDAEVTRTALPDVRMPEVHLVQVFQNLIGNALKYRKPNEKPTIHVEAKPNDGTWVFSVRDNGIGIAPKHQTQIFGIFRRLHGPDVAGTGIGLALCKKLIERSGGTIWVESNTGEGSTFYFTVCA